MIIRFTWNVFQIIDYIFVVISSYTKPRGFRESVSSGGTLELIAAGGVYIF